MKHLDAEGARGLRRAPMARGVRAMYRGDGCDQGRLCGCAPMARGVRGKRAQPVTVQDTASDECPESERHLGGTAPMARGVRAFVRSQYQGPVTPVSVGP